MYGAIFGDIIGSRFEFDRGGHRKEFRLFTRDDSYTDDTVMTIAVAEGLLSAGPDASREEIHRAVSQSMQSWGHRYPYAGYGGRFSQWLDASHPHPYGSYGNGSAMRVSAAGWLYDSLERTREVARATAEVTHNHPEGIKGAECTAAVIYLSRTGMDKQDIRRYVIREFGYDLRKSVAELRKRHRHDESCQDSLPKALVSFFEGNSYEDVVRNAVSLGGDTDTIAAIAGSMAEACYGIPVMIMADGLEYLPEEMLPVLQNFDLVLGRIPGDQYSGNDALKAAVDAACRSRSNQDFLQVMNLLVERMMEEGMAPTPMIDENHAWDGVNLSELTVGSRITLDQEVRLSIDILKDGDGELWIPLFTHEEEMEGEGTISHIRTNMPIRSLLESGYHSERAQGVVINPFGESLCLDKQILKLILDHFQTSNGMLS